MDGTHLTFWLWIYRIVAVGIACILSYFCGKIIGIIINAGEKVYTKLKGTKNV